MKSSGYENELFYTPLEYTSSFEKKYTKWSGTRTCKNMLQLIGSCYGHKYDDFGDEDDAITFMSIPNINGFTYLYNPNRWQFVDFENLMFHFRTHLIKMDFELVVSRNEYQKKGNNMYVRNMFFDNGDKDEKILLSLVYIDNRVKLLKFCHSTTNKKPMLSSFSYIMSKICQL